MVEILRHHPQAMPSNSSNSCGRSTPALAPPPGLAQLFGQQHQWRKDEEKHQVPASERRGAEDALQKGHIAQGQEDKDLAEDSPEEQTVGKQTYRKD